MRKGMRGGGGMTKGELTMKLISTKHNTFCYVECVWQPVPERTQHRTAHQTHHTASR